MVQCSGSCDDDKDYDKDDGTKDLQTREAQGFGFRAYDSYPFRVRCCVFKGVSRFQRFAHVHGNASLIAGAQLMS